MTNDYGQGKDSFLVEIVYKSGEVCRKIFNSDNSRVEAWDYLNHTQRTSKLLNIVKSQVRQVYSSDS